MIVKKFDDKIEIYNDNGKLHSFNDKPSIIFNSGVRFWHKNGKLHRDNGPAKISRYHEIPEIKFYIKGISLSLDDFCEQLEKRLSWIV